MNQVIIVGAGAAGVSAALGFKGSPIKPLILDPGHEPENIPKINQNLYDYRKENDLYPIMVGGDNFGLNNIINDQTYPPKILLPLNSYITRDSQVYSPLAEKGFTILQSFAAGGLASGWGAGLYRYRDEELKGLPVTVTDLAPYFNQLTEEIGISGAVDDLTPFFGDPAGLQPPVKLSQKSNSIFRSYLSRKKDLNRRGIFLGHPRLAVLTEPHQDRQPCNYTNLETWIPDLPYIYTPKLTLKSLVNQGYAEYRSKLLVLSWVRKQAVIEVRARDVITGKTITFKTRKLIIAAGPVNSARIVLRSKRDFSSRLKLLDNPLVQIPVFLPGFVGKKTDKTGFGMTNLNLVYKAAAGDTLLQGSLIELTSPPRSYLHQQFPFSSRISLKLTKYISGALMAMFLYFPSRDENPGWLKLEKDNTLRIESDPFELDIKSLRPVFRALRKIGGWCHPLLARLSEPGYAIHYAGTLPMKENPDQKYQCAKNGQLFAEPGVFLADGSLFPHVAAKNISFTIMANAMRIADKIARGGKE